MIEFREKTQILPIDQEPDDDGRATHQLPKTTPYEGRQGAGYWTKMETKNRPVPTAKTSALPALSWKGERKEINLQRLTVINSVSPHDSERKN